MSAAVKQNFEEHGHSHGQSVLARRPILTSVLIGFGSLAPQFFLSPQASLGYSAVLIGLIAGIYFGFAVTRGGPRDQFVEFSVSGGYAVAGIVGLVAAPIVLPLAYFGHALWDLAHHNRWKLPLVSIPQWYVPWCVIIDVIVGFGLIFLWRANGIL